MATKQSTNVSTPPYVDPVEYWGFKKKQIDEDKSAATKDLKEHGYTEVGTPGSVIVGSEQGGFGNIGKFQRQTTAESTEGSKESSQSSLGIASQVIYNEPQFRDVQSDAVYREAAKNFAIQETMRNYLKNIEGIDIGSDPSSSRYLADRDKAYQQYNQLQAGAQITGNITPGQTSSSSRSSWGKTQHYGEMGGYGDLYNYASQISQQTGADVKVVNKKISISATPRQDIIAEPSDAGIKAKLDEAARKGRGVTYLGKGKYRILNAILDKDDVNKLGLKRQQEVNRPNTARVGSGVSGR